ncbi:MAG: efflux RND transporter periplasmic adaptor subunit [Planctomycetota bacterium]|jgi:membrane fusion protein (multidrug efflux system)
MPATRPTLLVLFLLFGTSCSPSDTASEDGPDPAPEETSDVSLTSQEEEAEEDSKPQKEAILVRVAELQIGDVEKLLESTATVQSLDVVDLMPERAEPVIEIMVEEGDLVSAGQVLARLRDDNAQLAVAEAAVRVQETMQAKDQAKREYDRDKSLMEAGGPTGVLSDRDLETRRQTWEASKTAHETALVAQDRALLELEQCTLTSPIAGTVSARDISLGDMAAVGTRVFEITDLSHPKVILYRPQRELTSLRVGQKLLATSDALPGVEVEGEIERIAPTVDINTGTVKVTASLDPKGQWIPTGILAKLVLVIDTHEGALLLPKKALVHEGDRVYCYAVRDGHAVQVPVVQGFENETMVEAAEGTGLTLEDQVVVVGADRINDGDPVEIADE